MFKLIHSLTSYRGLSVQADLPFADHPECVVDVLRPAHAADGLPLVLHIHGGGFNGFSKDTHGHIAARYARLGCVVVNVNYRLAPRHTYPAAVEDVHAALCWAWRHADALGADQQRLLLTGESAGANLALGLLVSMTMPRPEPWAERVFDLGARPRAVHLAYGLLHVSDVERLAHAGAGHARMLRRIKADYLPSGQPSVYADPLVLLETQAPSSPLPPLVAVWGTKDPMAQDSERLVAALERLEAPVTAHPEVGAGHAYHLGFGAASRRSWAVMLDHAREHLLLGSEAR